MRTLKQLAQEAIDIQDACNPLGLSKGYAAALTDLREALEAAGQLCDTLAISRHPVNQMWTSKLHDLAGMGWSQQDTYGRAYEECKKLSSNVPSDEVFAKGWDHV